MLYKAKLAACSENRTKHSTQGEHHVESFSFSTSWYVKKPLGFNTQRSERDSVIWILTKEM